MARKPVTSTREKFRRYHNRGRAYARSRLPPGVRLLVGILQVIGGILGFLPVLGFWMIPLGISIAALDIRPLWLRWKGRNGTGNRSGE